MCVSAFVYTYEYKDHFVPGARVTSNYESPNKVTGN